MLTEAVFRGKKYKTTVVSILMLTFLERFISKQNEWYTLFTLNKSEKVKKKKI